MFSLILWLPQCWERVPLGRELVSFHRLSIQTTLVSSTVWPQFAMQVLTGRKGWSYGVGDDWWVPWVARVGFLQAPHSNYRSISHVLQCSRSSQQMDGRTVGIGLALQKAALCIKVRRPPKMRVLSDSKSICVQVVFVERVFTVVVECMCLSLDVRIDWSQKIWSRSAGRSRGLRRIPWVPGRGLPSRVRARGRTPRVRGRTPRARGPTPRVKARWTCQVSVTIRRGCPRYRRRGSTRCHPEDRTDIYRCRAAAEIHTTE